MPSPRGVNRLSSLRKNHVSQAIVLLSGGLDSTVAAWLLRPAVEPVLALTVDYGQKAARRELAAAYRLALTLGIPHRTVFIPYLREAAKGALTDPKLEIPRLTTGELDDVEGVAKASAAQVWVPNRNFALIAMAATWAETNGIDHVVCGFNREEAATFPDNSEEFIRTVNAALYLSTRNHVSVLAPTIGMDKREIVLAGRKAGAPLEHCWSCYLGGDKACETCESCRRFARALAAAQAS